MGIGEWMVLFVFYLFVGLLVYLRTGGLPRRAALPPVRDLFEQNNIKTNEVHYVWDSRQKK